MYYEFTAANVFDALGVPYDLSVKNNIVECPACHKKEFYMDMEKSTGHCYRLNKCGFRASHISYYAEARQVSNKEAYRQMCVYMGYIKDEENEKNKSNSINRRSKPRQVKCCNIQERQLIDISYRDKTNNVLLDILSLSNRHMRDLKDRGFTEDEIKSLRYRSVGYYDEMSCKDISDKVTERGARTIGVPGFCRNQMGEVEFLWTKPAILIPMVNFNRQINGFQIRKNDEVLKVFVNKDGKTEKEKKMKWLSATPRNYTDGTKIPAYGHYACDFAFDFSKGIYVPIFPGHELSITEGPMKGDLIHAISGKAVHAIPGVNAQQQLREEIPKWKDAGVETIVDLFDMDYICNDNVELEMKKLKDMMISNGFKYVRRDWKTDTGLGEAYEELKGYDDYLAFHERNIYERLKKK